MNKVLLTGRLTRDPELRVLASGKNVTTFSVAPSALLRHRIWHSLLARCPRADGAAARIDKAGQPSVDHHGRVFGSVASAVDRCL